MPNISRGGNIRGLTSYLAGPGRANEHTGQRVITGSVMVEGVYGGRELNHDLALELGRDLDVNRRKYGVVMTGRRSTFIEDSGQRVVTGYGENHVWHCSLSLHPDEPALDDQTWAKIAQDFMAEMRLTPATGADIEWAAIHHGPSKNGGDHIHIAAVLVDFDGRKIYPRLDYPRSQRAANVLEHKYGLAVVESREHGRSSIGETPAEQAKATRNGQELTERARLEVIMRGVLAISETEADYVRLLREANVLVRPRFGKGGMDDVVGYSVALKASDGSRPAWFGAGRVARDLTLSQVRDHLRDTPDNRQVAAGIWPTQAQRVQAGQADEAQVAWRDLMTAVTATIDELDRLDPHDVQGLANITRDAAGMMAFYANHYGKYGSGFARAARSLGRGAQLKRPSPAYRGYRRNHLLVTALRALRGRPMSFYSAFRSSQYLMEALMRSYQRAGQPVTARRFGADTAPAMRLLHAGERRSDMTPKFGFDGPPQPGLERPRTTQMQPPVRRSDRRRGPHL